MHKTYERVVNKVQREIKKMKAGRAPLQRQTTYSEPATHWYEPVLAGADTFKSMCSSPDSIRKTMDILRQLTPDEFISFLLRFYDHGLANFNERWVYSDMIVSLTGICRSMKVENYLEIGVRRGRSMAMVASQNPDCHIVGFDMWIQDYVGIQNPGPDFVRGEMKKVGFKGNLELVSGNSQKTVPDYFKSHPNAYFDIINVDGDHTRRGASIDIRHVIPRLKRGGVLVFDDIVNQYHPFLMDVWNKEVKKTGRFSTYEFTDSGYGVAIAVKKF